MPWIQLRFASDFVYPHLKSPEANASGLLRSVWRANLWKEEIKTAVCLRAKALLVRAAFYEAVRPSGAD